MNTGPRRWLLPAGLALIVLANAVALAGALYNRGAAVGGTLRLSQRELVRPYLDAGSEDSGLALRLHYQIAVGSPATRAPDDSREWLSAAQLARLGIVPAPLRPGSDDRVRSLPAQAHAVLLVLEFDGPAYRDAVARACAPPPAGTPSARAANACEFQSHDASRLFVVDVGLDLATARQRYPDAAQYAIVHGKLLAAPADPLRGKDAYGHVGGLAVDEIHVPLEMRAALDAAVPSPRLGRREGAPFDATVAFGRRLEPWLVAVSQAASR